jgi:hypothetical protein
VRHRPADRVVLPAIRIDPSDLNVPSIAIGDLAGTQTVTRTVTNVGKGTSTYNASVAGVTGVTTVVSPSSLTLAPGATGTFSVAFTRTSAAVNTYVGGQLTWADGTHNVRLPIVVRPVALAAPAQVNGTGGPISYTVRFGYTGPFTATGRGLIAPAITAGTVADDPTDSTCSLASPNAQKIDVAVPAGTTYARFALFDADVNPGSDIDMCVFGAPRRSARAAAARRPRRSIWWTRQRRPIPSSSRAGASSARARSSCTPGCWAARLRATWRYPRRPAPP